MAPERTPERRPASQAAGALVLSGASTTSLSSLSSSARIRGGGFSATAPGGLPSLSKTASSPALRSPSARTPFRPSTSCTPSRTPSHDIAASPVDADSWLTPVHATLWSPSQSASSESCRLVGIPRPATWICSSSGEQQSQGENLASTSPTYAKQLQPLSHIPWGQLNPSTLPRTVNVSRRRADRDRDCEVETEEFLLNDRLQAGGSLSSSANGGARSGAAVGPQCEAWLKEAWDIRRRFSPAKLPAGPLDEASLRKKKSTDRIKTMLNPSSFDVTKGSRLADFIETGAIGVVKSSYFEDCILHKRPINMRQLIPTPLMWSPSEAMENWQRYGKCFLIIVSYSWVSKQHPDPHQFHLRKLVRIIEEYKKMWSMPEVGVLLDYCSLWQRGAHDTRTKEQRLQYEMGYAEMIMAYGHKAVTSLQLTAVPPDVDRKYEDRGWTLLESIIIDSKGGDWNRWTFQDLDPESTIWPDPVVFFTQARPTYLRPPMSPKDFKEELDARRKRNQSGDVEIPLFMDPEDEVDVPRLYEAVFALIMKSSKLAYDQAKWGDVEVQQLIKVLPGCVNLESLTLFNNRITLRGATMIVNIVPRFRRTLKVLGLKGNPLCKDSQATDLLHLVWSREAKPLRNLVL